MTQTQNEGEDIVYLTNAFSVNMLQKDEALVSFIRVTPEQVRRFIANKKVLSFIGHPVTAQALSVLLQIPVETNRSMLKLEKGELIIFTLNGRLSEGQVITTIEEINKIGYSLWYANIR